MISSPRLWVPPSRPDAAGYREEISGNHFLMQSSTFGLPFASAGTGSKEEAMKGYGQFCPVARACQALTDRWTPLVLRELLAGSRRFSDLCRGVPLMSRSLLATRLRQLEDDGIIYSVPKPDGKGRDYLLTTAGERARPIIEQLALWGDQWLKVPLKPNELDASLLMWDVHRSLDLADPASGRVVVKFVLGGIPGRTLSVWWMIVAQRDVDLCITDPGYRVDVMVRADLAALTRFWVGESSWTEAVRAGTIEVQGDRDRVRTLAGWLGVKPPAGFRTPWFRATTQGA
jgi:DNA-binding HxlR family transcriptional regulator